MNWKKTESEIKPYGVTVEHWKSQNLMFSFYVSTCQNYNLFKAILKDCFANLPNPDGGGKSSARGRGLPSAKMRGVPSAKATRNIIDIEPALEGKAMEAGLVAHKPWIAKCQQLYTLSQIYNGMCTLLFLA